MPERYLSNRQKNLKVGISSYTENQTVVQITGNVGIGTTYSGGRSLYAIGDGEFTGVLTAKNFIGNVTGDSVSVTSLNVSGISTLGTVRISSGIITSTVGVVTYYGDGSNLTGVIAQSLVGVVSYSDRSGIATYSNFAGIATYSDTSGIATYSNFAGISTYSEKSGVSTALETPRTFQITGDIVASPVIFDGTNNVSLAATIQPNSVELGQDTTGDYVKDISGTSQQIVVTNGTGEGSTSIISLPTNLFAPQDLTVTRDLQVNRNLNVSGNITIGGTSAIIYATELRVSDSDIILGFRSDVNGNDVSNDNTANHGGVALASTEGSPLVNLYIPGIEEISPTYKKIMWFKEGTFSGLGTDAWLFNYAVGIGSTQFPNGTRLAVGEIKFTEKDLSIIRNINSYGIITASNFYGDGSNLTGIVASSIVGIVSYADRSGTSTNVSGGIASVTSLNVSGISTLGTVRISDGIITSTVGIVTYYGDGSNLIGVAASSLVGFASYSDRSGIATYSDFSGISTYSNFAGIATFSNRSGIATYSDFSGISTYSNFAGISTYSNFSGIATFSNRSGIATYSDFSGIATFSNRSGVATYSNFAGIATYSDFSGIATFSNRSGVATYSNFAGIATYSDFSGIATFSNRSGIATYSDFSGIATFSSRSGIATYSDRSGIATNVSGGIASVTSLNVSGISTLGTVRISSGIITSTVGVVTYYGDGSNLTGIAVTIAVGVTTNADYATSSGVIATTNLNQSFNIPYLLNSSGSISTTYVSPSTLTFNPSTNNLGIGTNIPLQRIQVNSRNQFIPSIVSIASSIGISTTFITGVSTSGLSIGLELQQINNIISSGTTITSIGINTIGIGTTSLNSTALGITTLTFGSRSDSRVITFTSDGSIGIGTTNPTVNSKLDVFGSLFLSSPVGTAITNKVRLSSVPRDNGTFEVAGLYGNLSSNTGNQLFTANNTKTGDFFRVTDWDSTLGLSTYLSVSNTGITRVDKISIGRTSVNSFYSHDLYNRLNLRSAFSTTTNYMFVAPKTLDSGSISFNAPVGAAQTNQETQIFSITNNLTSSIFRVNDINRSPIFEASSSGNVGIGITNPLVRFQVNDRNNFIPSFVATASTIGVTTTIITGVSTVGISTNLSIRDIFGIIRDNTIITSVGISQIGINTTTLNTGIQTNINLTFGTRSDTGIVAITSTGNVGLGTTSPQVKLDVYGSARINSVGSTAFQQITASHFARTGVNTVNPIRGSLVLDGIIDATTLNGGQLISILNDNNSLLSINRYSKSFPSVQSVLEVTQSGNIGIGTTLPTNLIEINSTNVFVTTVIAYGSTIGITTTTIIGINTSGLRTGLEVQSLVSGIVTSGTTVTSIGSSSIGIGRSTLNTGIQTNIPFVFGTRDNNRVISITSQGSVGLGTTSPQVKLDVYGSAKINSVGSATSQQITISHEARTALNAINPTLGSLVLDGITDYPRSNGGRLISILNDNNSLLSINRQLGINTFNPPPTGTQFIQSVLEITQSGNIGIGTTLPTNLIEINSRGTLDSTIVAYASSIGITTTIIGINTTGLRTGLEIQSFTGIIASGTTVTSIGSNSIGIGGSTLNTDIIRSSVPLTFGTRSNNRVISITSQGFVGLGTTSPQVKLDVYGSAKINSVGSATSQQITISHEARTALNAINPTLGSLVLDGITDYPRSNGGRLISILNDNNSLLSINRQLGINTFNPPPTGTQFIQSVLEITQSGNIGIGTTLPTNLIEINSRGTLDSTIVAYASSIGITTTIIGINTTGLRTGLEIQSFTGIIASGTTVTSIGSNSIGIGGSTLNTDIIRSSVPLTFGTRSNNRVVAITSEGYVGIRTTRVFQPFQVGSGDSIVNIDLMGDLGIGISNPSEKLHVIGNSLISGFSSVTDTRLNSSSEKTNIINGNTINLVYNTGSGNIAICTNPSGPITLNVTGIPTDSSFNNRSITFSVIVNQSFIGYACSNISLNGVTRSILWSGGIVAIGGTNSYDIFNFTGINTVGSASTASNYTIFGMLNGSFR